MVSFAPACPVVYSTIDFTIMAKTPLSEILKLSVAERIQLAEDIWDSIADEPDKLPVTPEQRQQLQRRSAAYRRDSDRAVPLDAALEQIEHSLD